MITIKPASDSDLKVIQKLAYEIWPVVYGTIIPPGQVDFMLTSGYSIDSLTRQVNEKKHHFILIGEDEHIFGYASYSSREEMAIKIYSIHKLYVLPEQHGKGLGKKLVNYIINVAQSAGAERLELNVNRYNPALAFYKKLGFEINREMNENIGHGYVVDDYVMILHLDKPPV